MWRLAVGSCLQGQVPIQGIAMDMSLPWPWPAQAPYQLWRHRFPSSSIGDEFNEHLIYCWKYFCSFLEFTRQSTIQFHWTKKVTFFCQLYRQWKCVLQTTRLKSCKTTRLRILDATFVSLLFLRCPSHVHLCGFLPFVSDNSRTFQGYAEPQLTLADNVFKMKFALHSELSMSANPKRS